MAEPISLAMSGDKPCRMSWGVREYRVLDEPTYLDMDYGTMTHPLPITAWRFTAAAEDGDTRVFDVRYDSSTARWCLVRCYA